MLSLCVFKPLGWKTASVEIWSDDQLIAEIFARDGGERRLWPSATAQAQGLPWDAVRNLASRIDSALDQADAEMKESSRLFGED